MRRTLLLLCVPLLAGPAIAHAQDLRGRGDIVGRVIDHETQQPLPGVRVEGLDDAHRVLWRAVTDERARFRVSGVRAGSFRIRASRIGYESAITPPWSIRGGEVLQVEIRLDVEAIVLAPLTIVAVTRARPSPVLEGFHFRRAAGLGHFISREEIEQRAPVLVSDLLTAVPGVRLEGSGRGTRRAVYFGRASGMRDCPAQIYVDGFLFNRQTLAGDPGFVLDDAVSPNAVEGIEVYRGLSGVPAEFLNPEAHCGVVVIWTRRGGATG